MKILHANKACIHAPLIGTFRTRLPLIPDKNTIYCSDRWKWRARYCGAFIYNGDYPNEYESRCTIPFLSMERAETNVLKDGDIITISDVGDIRRLYEYGSDYNALLVTTKCNCRCIMCPQSLGEVEYDTEERAQEFIKLINLLPPLKTKCLGITGGEPTLLGDGLIEILSACRQRLPNTAINLLTNGILFKDIEYAKSIALNAPVDTLICIPLYADCDDVHDAVVRRKSAFYETIKGIENLALCQQKIEIRNVIHSMTYKRLPMYAEFIYRNMPFVTHVAFMGLEVTEEARINYDMLWIEPSEYVQLLAKAVRILRQRNVNVSIYNLPLCVLPREVWKHARKSISSWKRVYPDECADCGKRDICGGIFESNRKYFAQSLTAQ